MHDNQDLNRKLGENIRWVGEPMATTKDACNGSKHNMAKGQQTWKSKNQPRS